MNTLYFKICLTFALFCIVSARSSASVVIEPLILPGLNIFEDTNVDRALDANGNPATPDVNNEIILQQGWTLEAIGRITNANSTIISDVISPYNLTFHSRIEILQINNIRIDDEGVEVADFVFGNGFGDGSAVRLYEDGNGTAGSLATSFTSTLGAATDISRATDGNANNPIVTAGIVAANSDFWIATGAPLDINLFRTLTPLLLQDGGFDAGLTVLTNLGGFPISTVGQGGGALGIDMLLHDLVLEGNLKNPLVGTSADWQSGSDYQFTFSNVIPEPTAVCVWGVLASLALVRVRRL